MVSIEKDLGDIVPGTGDPAAGGFMALTAAEHRGGTFMLAGVKIDPGENHATLREKNGPETKERRRGSLTP